jgi:hypothetical protein
MIEQLGYVSLLLISLIIFFAVYYIIIDQIPRIKQSGLQNDFRSGYNYAVSEYLKGLDTDQIQRQIDVSVCFDPTMFDKGASQSVSDIRDREKEQLLRFKYEMHEKLRQRVDIFNSIYLALHYDPTNPGHRLEDAMFSGRHLINELESLGLIEDSFHRIKEEKGYAHE